MNRIDQYASFISEQVYMDEIFSDRDKGFPYELNKKDSDITGLHIYDVDLPDHTNDAHVTLTHHAPNKADVSFDMPEKHYGLFSPEVKETYKSAMREHGKPRDAYLAVIAKHGEDAATKFSISGGARRTWEQTPYSAHHTYRMMSTVKKVMDEHGRKHPYIKQFTFEAMNDKNSRRKLYDAITKHHGGLKTPEGHYAISNPHYSGD